MRSLKYILTFAVGMVLFAFTIMHDYHTSTTKVELNTGSDALQFTSKFVTEDLEKAVGVSADNFEAFDAATEKYLRKLKKRKRRKGKNLPSEKKSSSFLGYAS